MRLNLLPIALVLALLSACGTAVRNPVSGQTEMSAMSEEQESAEGAKAHQQVLKEYSVYDNRAVQDYVNALGQRLAAQSHRSNLQWHFTVLDSPEINAFALPGGYFGLHLGLVGIVTSRDELASVLAHELSHVTQRHISRSMSRQAAQAPWVMGAMILGILAASKDPGAAQATIVSAAARHESRGAHTVDDYNDTPEHPNGRNDTDWHKHTLWYSEGSRLAYKPVQMKPLSVDSVPLTVRSF